MMTRSKVVALALVLAACGSSSEEPASSAAPTVTAPAPAPGAPPPSAPVAPESAPVAPGASAEPTPRIDVATRRRIVELVRTARGAARGQGWAEALASYQSALALDPSNARLRCETGYAAYRAGQLDDADQLISAAQRALPDPDRTPAPLRVPTAMCLYNASLVHEARGRVDDARAALEASLALRPNATVEQALARLGGAEAAAPAVVTLDGLDDAAIDARVWSLLCDDMERRECEPGDHDGDDEDWVSITRDVVEPPHAEGAPFVARIVVGSFQDPGAGPRGSDDTRAWLVVRDGAHALAGAIRNDHATETMDCGEGATRFEWADLVPGGAPELLVDARSCSVEQSGCGDGGSDERAIMVCAASPLRCVSIPVRDDSQYTEYEECGGMYEGEAMSETYDGYRMDVEIGATELTLRPTRGTPPVRSPIGTTPFAALLAREDLRWGS